MITKSEAGKLGSIQSKITQKKNHEKRIQTYLVDPKKCKQCCGIIEYKKRKNDFCDQSCGAKFNNKGVRRHGKAPISCLFCSSPTTNPKFCSIICQSDYVFETITTPRVFSGEISERNTLRKYLIKTRGYRCESCNLDTWMEQPIPLCLDHIDGNPANDFPNNLRLLCQNCHGLTPTFAGRNKGNGRKSQGIKRYDEYDLVLSG